MKKSLVSLLLAGVMTMGLLAGCGGSSGSSNESQSTAVTSSSAASSSTAAKPASDDGQTYEMRITHCYTENMSHGRIINKFKEYVEELTDGRIKVTVFPNGQLASSTEELGAVKAGACEAAYTISQVACAENDLEAIWNSPFLITANAGETNWSKELNADPIIQELINKGAKEAGFYRMGDLPTCCGIIMANNTRPILDPNTDAKGLKLRTPGGPAFEFLYGKMGASPISVSGTEVPVALQQGVVDGLVTVLYALYESKWATKYSTDFTICWSCTPLYLNLDWWNSLPEDLQACLTEAFNKAHEFACSIVAEEEPNYISKLEDEFNMQFDSWNFDDPSIRKFIEETRQGGIDMMIETYGDDMKALVDEIRVLDKKING